MSSIFKKESGSITTSNSMKNVKVFSLADQHSDIIKKFKEKEELLKQLEIQSSKNPSNKELHEQIAALKNNKDFYNYFIGNSSRLIKYFSNGSNGNINKASILDDYMKVSKQPSYSGKIVKAETSCCTVCYSEITDVEQEYCTVCGITPDQVIYCDQANFKEIVQEKPQFTYDRRHHFKELINQIQGKESTVIPQNIIDQVLMELKKHRIPTNETTKADIRKILKKCSLSKYYEHSAIILSIINPAGIITFTHEIETLLFKMFETIQEPFSIFCPDKRSNLINYNYIFYKFCQILMLEKLGIDYNSHFTLLKCPIKLADHERIWKKIIQYIQTHNKNTNDGINWVFIPLNA
jgi:hypothetical protein